MDLNNLSKGLNLKDLNLNASLLSILYRQYKEFMLPIVVVVVSIILVVIIVIPQTQAFLQNREELKKEQDKLSILKNNYSLLSGMDEADLNVNLQALSKALPSNKDFIGVINTISYNSVRQDVSIDDFEFQVGEISKNTADELESPFLSLTLNVSGSPQSILKFMAELYKSMPIAQVTNIKTSAGQSTLKLQFYYKSFAKGNISADTIIAPLSKEETELVKTVSSWNDTSQGFSLPIAISSESQASASPSATEISSPF
ncbi:MAG: hypothetical protein A2171_01860 [Candidatus Levybacteria bacterium RBG_13_35_9]|nr:MAG: hypothetical protein A2171_01860 [Candidatus Levybacteria bacterium RBG_13_35_9]